MSRKDLMDDLFGSPSMESLESVNKRIRKKRASSPSTPKWKQLRFKFGELYEQANGRKYLFSNNQNEQSTFETLVREFGKNPELLGAIVEFYFLSGQTKIPVLNVTVSHMKGGWLNELSINAEAYLKGTYTPQQGEQKRNREWIPTTAVASEKAPSESSKPVPKKKKRRTLL